MQRHEIDALRDQIEYLSEITDEVIALRERLYNATDDVELTKVRILVKDLLMKYQKVA